ncbi:MAG: glycosyltransferase [Gallionella sp.]
MTASGSPPLVSICVPTYNVANTVQETLASILSQTYPNITVNISDNASTDETLKVVASMKETRIHVHPQAKNIGAEGNFTRCIQLATGKYTAIFHADDIYESEIVAKQVAFLEAHPEVGAVFSEVITIDEQGVPFGHIGCVPNEHGAVACLGFRELLQSMLLHHNFLICASAMVRTDIYQNEIKAWGGRGFRSSADIDTWLRIARNHMIAVLHEPLMRYRISRAQFSHQNRQRTERADFFLVMDHYLDQPDVLSLLTPEDQRHYRWLERHEHVSLALNLLGLGRAAEAKKHLQGIFSWDAVYAAFKTRRGLVTLASGVFLRILILLGLSKLGMKTAQLVKNISWR